MKNKRRTPSQQVRIEPISDYGPGVSRTQDGRLVYHGSASVILEDRDDIERQPDRSGRLPVVRGARRSTTMIEMYNKRTINKAMYNAATRFLDDLSLATGGSGGTLGSDWIRVTPGSRDAMPERQMLAIGRVRRIMNSMGMNSHTVFWWVIMGNRSCSAFDARF